MSAVTRVNRVPTTAQQHAAQPLLHVDGLVAQPMALTPEDLSNLARYDMHETFTCDADRAAQGQHWRGIRVADVAALAEPLADAAFIRVISGGFVIPLDRTEAAAALLAEELNGEPLPVERGAPWRLIVPGGRCFTSVKWVTRLEVAAERGRDTGERIEQAQMRRAATTNETDLSH